MSQKQLIKYAMDSSRLNFKEASSKQNLGYIPFLIIDLSISGDFVKWNNVFDLGLFNRHTLSQIPRLIHIRPL